MLGGKNDGDATLEQLRDLPRFFIAKSKRRPYLAPPKTVGPARRILGRFQEPPLPLI